MKIIDLRSDTVTQPTAAMRDAMLAAPLGDDVYGEDPTVNRLQDLLAEQLGFEAALFAPSGTQSNLLGLMAHCERGDEYIVGQQAHTYRYEGGGAAVLGSIQPQPLVNRADGSLDPDEVRAAVKPDDFHFARTRLLCLENTIAGQVLSLDYLDDIAVVARQHGLAMHLDGARLFNAAVALDRPAIDICRYFDSVSVCLSKGLGAPVGSVLCGDRALIDKARRWRKVLGGGLRQAGVVAAAGIYALEHHIERLAEDHDKACQLAERLTAIDELAVEPARTNMVFVSVPASDGEALPDWLRQQGIIVSGRDRLRLVMHLDVPPTSIDRIATGFKSFFSQPHR